MAMSSLTERYEQERLKRQNASKGLAGYIARGLSPAFATVDPWIAAGTPVHRPVPDGSNIKVIIFGAGFAGLLAAAKCLIQGAVAGPEELLIVDPAGGFGGTWYWNRYPGLMCDVESYVYLPLLEETGYVPTRRYAGGEEIRKYCNILAEHYKLTGRAMFQSYGRALSWDGDHWNCEILEKGKGLPEQKVTLKADFVILGSGGFTMPKIPNTPGQQDFKGQQLHTGRWNYEITGGSPANPVLDKLTDKRVAIIGTGATSIQAVPELAKYAQKLYVVQRTPSAVDFRGNRDTDPTEWKTKIATKPGWQKERAANLQIFTEQSHDLPEDMVGDGFGSMPTISGAFGGPSDVKAEGAAKRIEEMRAIDDIRSDKVRARAEEVVKDVETAKKLQAWYPGWCKRPTFHDEFLPAFNRDNVHLVDTDGTSVERLTENSIVVNGQEYPVDVIVWSTGYGNPLTESLAGKAEMKVTGKHGQDMEELNKTADFATLHGCIGEGFPNLFLTGLNQAGVGVNQVQRLERQSEHNAYMIVAAQKKLGEKSRPIIEATPEACQKWGDELASAAHLTSGMLSCTPGYFTAEGDAAKFTPEVLSKLARTGIYGQGYLRYARILDDWEADGQLRGVNVACA